MTLFSDCAFFSLGGIYRVQGSFFFVQTIQEVLRTVTTRKYRVHGVSLSIDLRQVESQEFANKRTENPDGRLEENLIAELRR